MRWKGPWRVFRSDVSRPLEAERSTQKSISWLRSVVTGWQGRTSEEDNGRLGSGGQGESEHFGSRKGYMKDLRWIAVNVLQIDRNTSLIRRIELPVLLQNTDSRNMSSYSPSQSSEFTRASDGTAETRGASGRRETLPDGASANTGASALQSDLPTTSEELKKTLQSLPRKEVYRATAALSQQIKDAAPRVPVNPNGQRLHPAAFAALANDKVSQKRDQ